MPAQLQRHDACEAKQQLKEQALKVRGAGSARRCVPATHNQGPPSHAVFQAAFKQQLRGILEDVSEEQEAHQRLKGQYQDLCTR
jgi:hypothetical protein